MRRETERFVQFIKTGDVHMSNPLLGARIILLPGFQKIVDSFLSSEAAMVGVGGRATSLNTRNDMRWTAHKYFAWLTEQGFADLRGVGAEQIQNFLLYCSETMAMGSVHNIRIFMLKLYSYLYDSGHSQSSFAALLSFKVNRGKKIPETQSADELAAMLESIDRTTVEGKRAYAVMMLGIVLGLRACDIVALKLTDIEWINGEIRLLQAKTAISVILPLTKDIGEALSDYILNARPDSDSEHVFLRLTTHQRSRIRLKTIGTFFAIPAYFPAFAFSVPILFPFLLQIVSERSDTFSKQGKVRAPSGLLVADRPQSPGSVGA